ncbi:MAG: hypothetical protein ACOYIK_10610 [Coriobacteriales bacterium]|jgi:glycine cleavage system aminomethyltransferase T
MDMPTPQFHYSPLVPYVDSESTNKLYCAYTAGPLWAGVQPFEYTGWRDEMLSWHNSCYLHANLNPAAHIKISGTQCTELFKHALVNSFEKFPIGSGKHAIFCDDKGYIMNDGVLLRLGENEYEGFCLSPFMEFYAATGGYDVKIENGNDYVFQLAGPTSLAIVQAATGEDLTDIKFFHHRKSTIAGKSVTILRVGMAGSLAYEVHGDNSEAVPVYEALLEAGKPYGLKRLGTPAYDMTHWEGGYPQLYLDWLGTSHQYEPIQEFPPYKMLQSGRMGDGTGKWGFGNMRFEGSASDHPEKLFRTPYDNNWGKTVKFDHDFVGREALEEISKNPPRQMVTLGWNVDDILEVIRTQYTDDPCLDISEPDDFSFGHPIYHSDYVYVDGEEVGVTSGRMMSPYYHKMISLCPIKKEYAVEGTKVEILWGMPGKRQMKIRAEVARYPYNNDCPNNAIDSKTMVNAKAK